MRESAAFDTAVIGAGAAGLSAAAVTASAGRSTLVIDRESRAGGILRQCIHNGFGLRYFKEELTGPEYAERMIHQAEKAGAHFALDTSVMDLVRLQNGAFELRLLSAERGVEYVQAKTVVLAMGCRERCRGNINTPGRRPAGVFTAGSAQKLLNISGKLPGKTAVIVGSGDIGLIMARRLRWSGIDVKAVVEIMPYPSGLLRNVVQCLNDFGIPLYLSHSVVRIDGNDRVSGVEVAPLDGNRQAVMEKAFHIDCDTVLFSVGLVPEMELASRLGVKIDPATGGAFVNADYETSVPGVFSTGNVLHVHDLVDFVSEESARAGECVLAKLAGETSPEQHGVSAGENLKYVIPGKFVPGRTEIFSFRPTMVADQALLEACMDGHAVWRKKIPFVRPAEMLNAELEGSLLQGRELTFRLVCDEKEAGK